MRVLILHKWLIIGGVEKILINLIKNINGGDIKIDVLINYQVNGEFSFENSLPTNVDVFYGLNTDGYSEYKDSYKSRKENVFKKIRYSYIKSKHSFIYANNLINTLSKNNYDLVIDFSECLDRLIIKPRVYNKLPPTIKWMHSQLNSGSPLGRKEKIKHQRIFSKHKKILSICEQMTYILQDFFPEFPKDKFHTLYNPIDLSDIQKKSQEKLGCILHSPYILQVSRLVKGKGHEELLEIYALLKQRGLKHKLYFIGDGENRQNLEELITELGLEQDCFLLGAIENPYPYFKNADLFVHTSEHEGLPTVLLESMACGIPVVSMDCPTGPKDILGKNNEYGILIPMHDKIAFCEAVYNLLHNKEIYEYYSLQSKKRIQDFSIENIAPKLEQLFKDIAQLNYGLPKP